jgi:hypothetical protein
MIRTNILRVGCLLLLAILGSCAGPGKPPLRFIADSNELDDASTPSGFLVSPREAKRIFFRSRGLRKYTLYFFHDDENYYVDGFSGFKEPTPTSARRSGTIINGRTGQVYDHKSKSWEETEPREAEKPLKPSDSTEPDSTESRRSEDT